MMRNTFDMMLELPLFLGMSHNDLNQVVAQTKFGFHRIAKGKTFIHEGDPCENIFFLVKGDVQVESIADDNSYRLLERMKAPDVLQPERIFGLNQRYSKSFTAITVCQLISINKADTLRLAQEQMIFQLNLLGIISTQSQRITHQPWRTSPTGIRNKIIRFVETHSMRPAGEKILQIKMETLASLIAESRLNVSRELNHMNEEGMIHLSRGVIAIPALENLMK